MSSLALWMNILAFAFMASSMGLTLVVRARKPRRWLDWYLLYAGGYAAWAVLFSIQFFLIVYETDPPQWYNEAVIWLRLVVSGTVALSLPMILACVDKPPRRADDSHAGARHPRRDTFFRTIGIALAATFVTTGFLTRPVPTFRFSASVNIAFNACLGALCITGFLLLRRSGMASARRLLGPFFVVSTAFYGIAVGAGVVLLIRGTGSLVLSLFAVAAYCIPWSVIMIHGMSRHLVGTGDDREIPVAFSEDYDLTPREREVLAALMEGKSNAQIADEQYVSRKTIETHLYNIFRKTDVRNRVELIRLVGTYRAG